MRRALLCACNEYRDPAFVPLKFPLNDVDRIGQLLGDPDLCGFEPVEVLRNPTKGEAHEAVECLTADSAADDLILFYFSGHGKLAGDGSVALVFTDTKESRLHATGLLDDQLRILFNASRARQRVMILDCCYSGAAGEEGFRRASGDAVEALAQQIRGTFVLSASTKFQPAMECEETKGGAFTSCLIEGVRTGAAAEKGTDVVTLSKLGEYLVKEVPLRSNQQPKFWDFGGIGAIEFARIPKRFDGAWTDQTVKKLQRMMGRQIDDELFVELQQLLRGTKGPPTLEALRLVDDLAQRRLITATFMRKWQALEAVSEPRLVTAPDKAEKETGGEPAADEKPQEVPQPEGRPEENLVELPPEVEASDSLSEERTDADLMPTMGEDEAPDFHTPDRTDPVIDPEPPLDVIDEPGSEPVDADRVSVVAVVMAVLAGLVMLLVEPYDSDTLLITSLAAAIAQTAVLACMWRLLPWPTLRGGLVLFGLVAAFLLVGSVVGFGGAGRIYSGLGLWISALLLAVLHSKQRIGAGWGGDTSFIPTPEAEVEPVMPNPAHLVVGVIALLLSVSLILIDPYDLESWWLLALPMHVALGLSLWTYASTLPKQAGLVIAYCVAGYLVLQASTGYPGQGVGPSLVPFALLLIGSYLLRRGQVAEHKFDI